MEAELNDVEQAWYQEGCKTSSGREAYFQGISDFKASLREEIEKLPNDGLINGRKKGRQALLDLIDNVKPSTSQPEGNTVNMK